jgi:hypothetical protein
MAGAPADDQSQAEAPVVEFFLSSSCPMHPGLLYALAMPLAP